MNKLVSIILPTHNGEVYISDAISSVINQTYTAWELIIVDDGSLDNTASVIRKFKDPRIILIENDENQGIQKSLNIGLGYSKGEYIARIDDDDRWILSNKLELQVEFLESNSDYVLVGTDANVVDKNGNILSINKMPKTDFGIRPKILSRNCFLHATILMRKSALDNVGNYNETIDRRHVEDYDLWLRLGLLGKMENLEIVSTNLIANQNSLTSKNRLIQAKNSLKTMLKYRKKYPNFLLGLFVSALRYVFFFINIPLPKKLRYKIQRIYKSL